MNYSTKSEVLTKAKEAINIPFAEIDKTNRISELKGGIGHLIEESFFGYKINSDSEPDFKEAGIELKVTPYKKLKSKQISAKERLVLNIINYEKEVNTTFETSSFYKKNNNILMMFYEYKSNEPKTNWCISNIYNYILENEDIEIIKRDWEYIVNKIKNGQAHLLSEGDTMYLGACCKGANHKTLRTQPYSNELAMQRAFCFKNSYMTWLLRNKIFSYNSNEKIIEDSKILKEKSFEDYILEKVKPYIGLSQQELCDKFNLNITTKSVNNIILSRIFNLKGSITNSSEFKKANITPKTIRINKNGKINESMSFKAFDFIELASQEWEETDIYNTLSSTKFLFMIFEENKNNEYIFTKIKFWNMPIDDIEEVEKVFNKTVNVINNGVKLYKCGKQTINNFPKITENTVSHIRPHARNAADTLPLPNGSYYTKQCFWLNRDYILKQIKGI